MIMMTTPPRFRRHRDRLSSKSHITWLCVSMRCALLVLVASIPSTVSWFEAGPMQTVEQFVVAPVIQIEYPPHDYLHADLDLDIELQLRMDSLFSLHRTVLYPFICIAARMVFVPEDVVASSEHSPHGLAERCFQVTNVHATNTSFHLNNLSPGGSYEIVAILRKGTSSSTSTNTNKNMNANVNIDANTNTNTAMGPVLGISMRTFKVASFVLTGSAAAKSTRVSVNEAIDLGIGFQQTHEWDNAENVYKAILELFPHFWNVRHLLGVTYSQQSRWEQAWPYLKQAADHIPTNVEYWVALGRCEIALGRQEAGKRAFRNVLDIDSNHWRAPLRLGELLLEEQDWKSALEMFRRVVATLRVPQETDEIAKLHDNAVRKALYFVCEITRMSDTSAQAERCLTETLQQWPQDALFHNLMGRLRVANGETELALQAFQHAAQSNLLCAMIAVGSMMEQLGDPERSTTHFARISKEKVFIGQPERFLLQIFDATVLPRILPASQKEIDFWRHRFNGNVVATLQQIESNTALPGIIIDPTLILFSTGAHLQSHNENNVALKRALGKLYAKLWDSNLDYISERYINDFHIDLPILPQQEAYPPSVYPQPRLRVGILSKWFLNPSTSMDLTELLSQLDRNKYEVIAYFLGAQKREHDMVPMRFFAEELVALPYDVKFVREYLLNAKLDMLIFPELGLDEATYILSFTKFAPYQVAWWGHPETTGVPTISHYLVSEYEHQGFAEHYTEPTYQMKGLGWYHKFSEPKSNEATTREALRRHLQDHFNLKSNFRFYLCIDELKHIHPDFDSIIGQLLSRDPNAQVFFVSMSNRRSWKTEFFKRVRGHVGNRNAVRVNFVTDPDRVQLITLLRYADAILGSVHVTQLATVVRSIEAGVPVATMESKLWTTRIRAAFYKHMGISDLIAHSDKEYVELAMRLATDKAFKTEMQARIVAGRARISKDRIAVREWERFLDMAAADLHKPECSPSDASLGRC